MKESLYFISEGIDILVVLPWCFHVLLGWNNCYDSTTLTNAMNVIAGIPSIHSKVVYVRIKVMCLNKAHSMWVVTSLSFSEREYDSHICSCCYHVNLCCISSTRSSYCLRSLFFWAHEASWWARTTVLSRNTILTSRTHSAWSFQRTLDHVPFSVHLLCRV